MRDVKDRVATVAPILIALGVACIATLVGASGFSFGGVSLPASESVDDWSKVLAFTFGIPGAVLALFTYERGVREQRNATLWNRREFLATRFDRIESLPACKAAMRLLDYNATYVDLDGLRGTAISDLTVMGALAPHQQRGAYTEHEQIIRDAFDTLFSEFDRIAAMANAGLVDSGDLRPYIDYWLQLFDPRERGRPPAYGAVLRRYVRVFHFGALASLLEDRKLMCVHGDQGSREAEHDDSEIAKFDADWAAPGASDWTDRIDKVEASS